MAERVIIKEVAARDGLQAQSKHLTVEQRMALVAALAAAAAASAAYEAAARGREEGTAARAPSKDSEAAWRDDA